MHACLVLLLLGGGVGATGCSMSLGTPGELGQGTFYYDCTGPADPYCDGDPWPGPEDATCLGCWTVYENHQLPDRVAVGATLGLWFESNAGTFSVQLVPASAEMLEPIGTGDLATFRALEPGTVAVLHMRSGAVEDFTYLHLVAPARISVDEVGPNGLVHPAVHQVRVAPGESTWLRAQPTDAQGRPLYGALSALWTRDGTSFALLGDPNDNLVQVAGDATGLGTLRLTLGELSTEVQVEVVGDGTPLGEAQP